MAFAAFVDYRDTGAKRSIAKTVKARQSSGAKASIRVLEGWSAKFQWVARCEAWDQHLDKRRTDAAAQEVEEMRRRHIQTAQAMQGLGVRELEKLLRKSEASGGELVISTEQLRWFLKDGTGMERLNLGEPTDVQQLQTDADAQAALENMTPDQIKLQKILNKVARGEALDDTERAKLAGAGAE